MPIIEADSDVTPVDLELGRRVLEVLNEHYPGWVWLVDVPPKQNIVVVRNYDCDPRGKYGIVFHKDRLNGSDMRLKVMMAGGEFLERYKVVRAGYDIAAEYGFQGRIMTFEKPDA